MTTVINTYAGVDVFCIDHPACCCCCCCCCYRINKNVRCGRRSVRYGTILVVVSIQSNPIQSNAICLYQHILVPIRSVISHTTCNHHNNNLTTALAYMRVDRTFRFPAVAVAVLCFIRKIELYGMVLRCASCKRLNERRVSCYCCCCCYSCCAVLLFRSNVSYLVVVAAAASCMIRTTTIQSNSIFKPTSYRSCSLHPRTAVFVLW